MKHPQSRRSGFFAGVSVLPALFLLASLMSGQTEPGNDNRAPEVPEAIQVPGNTNKVHFHADAAGTQTYTWNGSTWGSSVPNAVLFDADGEIVGTHFAGPTWESESGGKVLGTRVNGTSLNPPVDPDAIPWLLLRAAHTEGPGIFARITYVQRVNTAGGKAPAPGTFVGQVASVPYTAEYYFYSAKD